MIDLAVGYRQVAEILARAGLHCSYALSVQVWHHEFLDGEPAPAVTFTASIIHGSTCIHAHEAPTLEAAVAELDRRLSEYIAALTAPPPPLQDLTVEVPIQT